ncbi:DUF3397 domain-containing protein [Paenibacillus sp. GP183]|uniref:DUF3397 domain-containing protein n=1 Tax=Paenibacillus sp. GP183 TaxID=1882751 RepID=UPI00209B788A|nr:DUF3397 domain-containing protein [Paenibacillus sp. GP183]
MIVEILLNLYSWLAALPFVTFIVIWFGVYLFLKNKKLTTRLSMDITMLFLIGSVSVIWNQLFQAKFGFWLIILVLLISFGLIGGYQNQAKGKTDLLKVFRVVWRLGFLTLSVLYIVLLLANILKNMIIPT